MNLQQLYPRNPRRQPSPQPHRHRQQSSLDPIRQDPRHQPRNPAQNRPSLPPTSQTPQRYLYPLTSLQTGFNPETKNKSPSSRDSP